MTIVGKPLHSRSSFAPFVAFALLALPVRFLALEKLAPDFLPHAVAGRVPTLGDHNKPVPLPVRKLLLVDLVHEGPTTTVEHVPVGVVVRAQGHGRDARCPVVDRHRTQYLGDPGHLDEVVPLRYRAVPPTHETRPPVFGGGIRRADRALDAFAGDLVLGLRAYYVEPPHEVRHLQPLQPPLRARLAHPSSSSTISASQTGPGSLIPASPLRR